MFNKVNEFFSNLNNSKYFAGLVMIMLNIGSKYITIGLSKTQEEYLRNSVGRILLLFSIIWMGTRDIIISLILTSSFIIMTQYLFNEKSSLCILPKQLRALESAVDIDGDGEISEEEIMRAVKILEKAKEKDHKIEQLQMLNSFRS